MTLDTSYFATCRRAPPYVKPHVAKFLRALDALPEPAALAGDEVVIIPPTRRLWRHILGASGWSIHYAVRVEDILVRNVTEDPLPF